MASKGEQPVHIPSQEELTQRLTDGGFWDLTPQTNRFYRRFVSNIADKDITGEELVTAWEAAHEILGDNTLQTAHQVIESSFKQVIPTVIPDKRFARQVIQIRETRLRNHE